MIKFFRKIRQSLLTQNKMSKYLLYAFGEIILVVIGILLALNINNRNQQKINEDKITNILKEIQQDLVSDVERSKEIFDRFIRADSIQDLILNDKYTYNDYKSKKARRLPFWYVDFVINTNGYDNLMRNIDNVPEKYEPLLKDLKNLYVDKKAGIDVYNVRIRETVYKNIDHVWTSYDWNRDWIMGKHTDDAYNYYLNASEYKNMVMLYMNDRSNTFSISQSYSFSAIEAYHKINDTILNHIEKNKKTEETEFDAISKFEYFNKIKNDSGKISSFLTIQEGCDKFCHFCVVPYTRGPEYSRPFKQILNEAKYLADSGTQEIILLGQNVNAYNDESYRLSDLILEIENYSDIKRVRYTTSHPKDMSDDLIEVYKYSKKLMPLVHLPVQSGSNKVLDLMNRKHTISKYYRIHDQLKKINSNIIIIIDFISF